MDRKNAIVYLLNKDEKDILNFRESINRLYSFFLKNHGENCDVILFHEEDFPESEIYNISFSLSRFINVKFEKIELSCLDYPDDILKSIPEYFPHPDFPQSRGFGMGYRGMCDFFSGGMFKLDILKDYKYIWRLDTDSFLLAPISESVFKKMSDSSAIYGYVNIQNDHPGTCVGFWEFCEKFFKTNQSLLVNPDVYNQPENHKNKVFYSNFEIFDLDWFSKPDGKYFKFYEAIRSSAGIYTQRWGDHVIRYMALKSMVKESLLLFFDNIDYFHQQRYLNRKFYNNFK